MFYAFILGIIARKTLFTNDIEVGEGQDFPSMTHRTHRKLVRRRVLNTTWVVRPKLVDRVWDFWCLGVYIYVEIQTL